jgi:hypothetical protein
MGMESTQHTRRNFLLGSGAAVGAAALASGGLNVGAANAATAASPGRKGVVSSLQQVALDAVVFGVPAVLQSRYLNLADEGGFARNQFAINLALSTPDTHVAGPNDDTLYGFTYLDLTDGPQVIEVPATPGRYFSIQLIDFWTNVFAYIGTRTTGSVAGAFAITPPGWNGRLPGGVTRVESTTKRLLALVRTEVTGPDDLPSAQAIHSSYTTGPLSRYPRERVKPAVVTQALDIFAPLDLSGSGTALFEEINDLIREYPPLPRDATYVRALRPVGVGVPHYRQPDAALAGTLQAAITPALTAIAAKIPALPTETATDWSVNYGVQSITHDPLTRAALSIYGPGTHIAKEALYFNAAATGGGALTGAHDYTLTFPAGQLPPVGAFWSVILYDATTFWLVANPINRYEVASHSGGLVYGADGSLTIAVSNARPTDPAVNWLPAPTGGFRLILRTYLPATSVLDGTWLPPALVQVS